MPTAARQGGADRATSVSRVLLGLGVVVGTLYLVVGLLLALASEGFDFSAHPLSLLMLGEHGWIQASPPAWASRASAAPVPTAAASTAPD